MGTDLGCVQATPDHASRQGWSEVRSMVTCSNCYKTCTMICQRSNIKSVYHMKFYLELEMSFNTKKGVVVSVTSDLGRHEDQSGVLSGAPTGFGVN